jgi:tetratricopeptide (TPR) repeat protein
MKMQAISLLFVLLAAVSGAFAQADEARQAIDDGQYVRAIELLLPAISERPTPDAFYYLGIAYAREKDYQKAQNILTEGSRRYPQDPRFHNELANLFLENNDADSAKSELRQTLVLDPDNPYASDLLATIDMSEGDVQSALKSWNRSGRPVINEILHNYYVSFGSWVVGEAMAFHPGGVLHYNAWKTTESRLRETENFANVGLEVEPTQVPDQYNAVVRTSAKTNALSDFLFNLVKGAPVSTSYFDVWNIGNSGINFNGNYRWDKDRKRAEGHVKVPLPLPGLVELELGNTWRRERWDLSPSIRPELQSRARFAYKANAMQVRIKQIPHYRVELGAALEYRNRDATGDLPELSIDGTNTGKFTVETNLRLVDRRYQSHLHLEGFAARRNILGDSQFSGGVFQFRNRLTVSKDTRTFINWSLKGGTARGRLPVEDYFVLGLDTRATNPLRGHVAANHGRYGRGPMGTDFLLVNTDIDRHLATLPFFNNFNIPFISVQWQVFFDGAKTWDRNRIFQQGKLWLDAGAGLRFETPTHSFNLVYGRSLREGKNILFGYYERRLW